MSWLFAGGAILGAGALTTFLTPGRVRYTETTDIDASASSLYDHIRLQERLMSWSAWPSETGSTCACEGTDGTVGARTVFFGKDGKKFGHQEVTALEPNRRVTMVLEGKGPPHWPVLVFELEPLSPTRTRVHLHFDNKIMRPFNLILRVAGIVRWTREMHVKDLHGLKQYAEPPHKTYAGDPALELQAA